jgi:EpsI family protein
MHELISIPLQGMSTTMAAFALELFGFFVVREGNVLRIGNDASVAVNEACSGLRMLTAFVLVAAVFAFIIRRPAWHKLMIVLSSIPIALVANALRLIATSTYITYVGNGVSTEIFHDYAGLAMMPLAVIILVVEDRLMMGITDTAVPRHFRRWGGSVETSFTDSGQNRNRQEQAGTVHPMLQSQPRPLRFAVFVAGSCLLVSGLSYRMVLGRLQQLSSVRVVLDPPLSAFPMVVGSWQGERVPLSAAVLRVAKNDDYISRRYVNADTGEVVNLYVAYTARPRTMLGHRPRICYPSAGWLHQGTKEAQFETGRAWLSCLVHRFQEAGLRGGQQLVLNYYVLNGQPTIDENGFSSIRWRDPNLRLDATRYVAQVQIIVPSMLDVVAAEHTATRFATASVDGLLALLPHTGATAPPETEEN